MVPISHFLLIIRFRIKNIRKIRKQKSECWILTKSSTHFVFSLKPRIYEVFLFSELWTIVDLYSSRLGRLTERIYLYVISTLAWPAQY